MSYSRMALIFLWQIFICIHLCLSFLLPLLGSPRTRRLSYVSLQTVGVMRKHWGTSLVLSQISSEQGNFSFLHSTPFLRNILHLLSRRISWKTLELSDMSQASLSLLSVCSSIILGLWSMACWIDTHCAYSKSWFWKLLDGIWMIVTPTGHIPLISEVTLLLECGMAFLCSSHSSF